MQSLACVQVEKEVVKAIRQMEEVEVEVKKKKEVSSRVKQLRRQVSATPYNDMTQFVSTTEQCSTHKRSDGELHHK